MASVSTKPQDPAKPAKRNSRPSIRHSLNFASVGKALVDVIHKDGKEIKGPPQKNVPSRRASTSSTSSIGSKDMAARRASTVGIGRPSKPLDTLLEGQVKSTNIPSQSTITQVRGTSGTLQKASRSSVDENGAKLAPSSIALPHSTILNNRAAPSLRTRKTTTGSSLPKYRPRSVIVEGTPKESVSAIRIGSLRKHSNSDDEKDTLSISTSGSKIMASFKEKSERCAIPRRSSRTSMTSSISSISSFKPPQPSKEKGSVSVTSTPPRPKKAPQTPSPLVQKTGLPKPSSQTNSPKRPSDSPRTPTSIRSAASRFLGRKDGRETPSPLRSMTANGSSTKKKTNKKAPAESESNQNTPTAPEVSKMPVPADMSIDEIEQLLAAAPTTTPSKPRLGDSIRFNLPDPNHRGPLHQHSVLDLSLPPPTPGLGSSLTSSPRRTSPSKRTTAERTSIANWQALADLSLEINADELQGGLITELDLPSTPAGLVSPSPSIIRMESDEFRSPTPLMLSTPSKYSSISQRLVPPSITPSPSHRNSLLNSSFSSSHETTPTTDSATVTLLKMQLCSAEGLARERLSLISRLEEQISSLKETRKRDENQLLLHVNELEEKLHETLAARERERCAASSYAGSDTSESEFGDGDADEHTVCRNALEDRVKQVETERQAAISDALSKLAERERAERSRVLQEAEKKQRFALATRDAQQQWGVVNEVAQSELEVIKSNRDTLAILRASLDFFEAQVHISARIKIPPASAAKFHLS